MTTHQEQKCCVLVPEKKLEEVIKALLSDGVHQYTVTIYRDGHDKYGYKANDAELAVEFPAWSYGTIASILHRKSGESLYSIPDVPVDRE